MRSSFPLLLRERIHCGHVSIFLKLRANKSTGRFVRQAGSGTMRVRVVRQTDVAACSKKPQFVVSPHAAVVQGAFDT
jgi:hypothetical protein